MSYLTKLFPKMIMPAAMPRRRQAPSAAVIADVAEFYGVTVAEILSPRRERRLSEPRHVAMWCAARLTGQSLPQLARAFRRDHTTIMYAVREVTKRRAANPAVEAETDELYAWLVQRVRLE